jgi:hypothetical protein
MMSIKYYKILKLDERVHIKKRQKIYFLEYQFRVRSQQTVLPNTGRADNAQMFSLTTINGTSLFLSLAPSVRDANRTSERAGISVDRQQRNGRSCEFQKATDTSAGSCCPHSR